MKEQKASAINIKRGDIWYIKNDKKAEGSVQNGTRPRHYR